MHRLPSALLPLLALVAACASTPHMDAPGDASADSGAERVWAKIDGSYAAYGDFERAEAACGVRDGLPDVAAAPSTPRASRAYEACMREKGWALVAIE